MDRLAVKGQQDRCHIAMNANGEVRYWTKHFGVTREELQKLIDKVGNSAAAVRKELARKPDKSSGGKIDKASVDKASAGDAPNINDKANTGKPML
jgi:hypothetical protein